MENTHHRPFVGLGLFLLKDNKTLLGKRRGPVAAGFFAGPGGGLEYGESIHEALLRELREEIGDK